jgi:hypothetical protein
MPPDENRTTAEAVLADALRDMYEEWDNEGGPEPTARRQVMKALEISTFTPQSTASIDALVASLERAENEAAFADDEPDAEAGMAAFILNALLAEGSDPLPGLLDVLVMTSSAKAGTVIAVDTNPERKPLIVRHEDGSIGYYHTEQVRPL